MMVPNDDAKSLYTQKNSHGGCPAPTLPTKSGPISLGKVFPMFPFGASERSRFVVRH